VTENGLIAFHGLVLG
jgi:hypothetical protein